MRVNPRLLGLTLVAMTALAVPAFAGAGIARLSVLEGSGINSIETEVEFSGAVASIGAEAWIVGDQTVAVTPDTEIQDGIVVGDVVVVHALQDPDGTLTAREIKIEDDGAAEDLDEGEVKDGQHEDLDDGDVEDGEHEDIDDGDVEDGDHEDVDGDVHGGEHGDTDHNDLEHDLDD